LWSGEISYQSVHNCIDIGDRNLLFFRKKQNTVHPEPVEGWVAKPFMLRRTQHERLSSRRICPLYYGLLCKMSQNLRPLPSPTLRPRIGAIIGARRSSGSTAGLTGCSVSSNTPFEVSRRWKREWASPRSCFCQWLWGAFRRASGSRCDRCWLR